MSWLFSQALAEEYLAESFTADEPSAQLNVMPTPHKFWRNDKTMESSKLSQFGLTLRLLTEDHGAALLTSFLAASRAKTLAQREQEQESTASAAGYGPIWHGSFAKFDRDALKWKTAQCSLLGDSDEFLETWPRWGSMRNGASFLRPIPVLPICESESGFWQTPVADDAVERTAGKWNSRGEPKLSAEVKLWPTPVASDTGSRSKPYAQSGAALSLAVKMWPTPTATLATKGGRVTPRKGREGGTLIEAVSARRWPTPRANDAEKRWNFDTDNPRNGLAAAAKKWPTPCASASASKGSSPASLTRKSGKSRENDRIDHAVMASDGGQLNPEWVEWLMGWPIGWTELKPLAMDKFHEWKRQHGEFWESEDRV